MGRIWGKEMGDDVPGNAVVSEGKVRGPLKELDPIFLEGSKILVHWVTERNHRLLNFVGWSLGEVNGEVATHRFPDPSCNQMGGAGTALGIGTTHAGQSCVTGKVFKP